MQVILKEKDTRFRNCLERKYDIGTKQNNKNQ